MNPENLGMVEMMGGPVNTYIKIDLKTGQKAQPPTSSSSSGSSRHIGSLTPDKHEGQIIHRSCKDTSFFPSRRLRQNRGSSEHMKDESRDITPGMGHSANIGGQVAVARVSILRDPRDWGSTSVTIEPSEKLCQLFGSDRILDKSEQAMKLFCQS